MITGCSKQETLILHTRSSGERAVAIEKAANILKSSGLVAFPTETVYGLGAVALDAAAVRKIFIAKNRPADNPLIVHISDFTELLPLVTEIPPDAEKLALKFWSGPLTLILKRSDYVPAEVSAGKSTLAVRVPAHPIALALIRATGSPIAAPSANISGRPSPTEAAHVAEDLSGCIDAILDGGPCQVGLESTVLDLSGEMPVLLRPGGLDLAYVEDCLGKRVKLISEFAKEGEIRSPGMKYRHYAPKATLILFAAEDPAKNLHNMAANYRVLKEKGFQVGILCYDDAQPFFSDAAVKPLGSRDDLTTASAVLFRALRYLDRRGVNYILAEGCQEEGRGLAIMNRLRKAADNVVN